MSLIHNLSGSINACTSACYPVLQCYFLTGKHELKARHDIGMQRLFSDL